MCFELVLFRVQMDAVESCPDTYSSCSRLYAAFLNGTGEVLYFQYGKSSTGYVWHSSGLSLRALLLGDGQ